MIKLRINIPAKTEKLQKYPNKVQSGPPITGPNINPTLVTASAYPRYFSLDSAKTWLIMAYVDVYTMAFPIPCVNLAKSAPQK